MTLHEKIAELRREKRIGPQHSFFYIYKYSYTMKMYDTPTVIQYPILLFPLWFYLELLNTM